MKVYSIIINKYLKPKLFEVYKKDSIYRYLGIKYFKKYVPTSGDYVRRYYGIKYIKFNRQDQFSELYAYELKTRKLELRHLLGMFWFILLIPIIKEKYSTFDYFFVSIMFLIINVYPIMLQRHNRIRILKILDANKKPSPYN